MVGLVQAVDCLAIPQVFPFRIYINGLLCSDAISQYGAQLMAFKL
jgi:hypothetical protein